MKKRITRDQLEQIANDKKGNTRYVVHFLLFVTPDEIIDGSGVKDKYDIAMARAKKIGGIKCPDTMYGGGVMFTSNDVDNLMTEIDDLMEAENAI